MPTEDPHKELEELWQELDAFLTSEDPEEETIEFSPGDLPTVEIDEEPTEEPTEEPRYPTRDKKAPETFVSYDSFTSYHRKQAGIFAEKAHQYLQFVPRLNHCLAQTYGLMGGLREFGEEGRSLSRRRLDKSMEEEAWNRPI